MGGHSGNARGSPFRAGRFAFYTRSVGVNRFLRRGKNSARLTRYKHVFRDLATIEEAQLALASLYALSGPERALAVRHSQRSVTPTALTIRRASSTGGCELALDRWSLSGPGARARRRAMRHLGHERDCPRGGRERIVSAATTALPEAPASASATAFVVGGALGSPRLVSSTRQRRADAARLPGPPAAAAGGEEASPRLACTVDG